MQGTSASDVALNGFPLFHVAGVLPGALTALSSGMHTLIPTPGLFRNREVIANYWKLAAKYRVTVLSAVPAVLATLATVPIDADISSIRYCRTGAAPLSPELAARFERHTGLHVHESLGMTETAGISTITPLGVTAPVASAFACRMRSCASSRSMRMAAPAIASCRRARPAWCSSSRRTCSQAISTRATTPTP